MDQRPTDTVAPAAAASRPTQRSCERPVASASAASDAAALESHPKNVYLPERAVLEPLNGWLGGLFARENVDRTIAALLDSQDGVSADRPTVAREALQAQLAETESRLKRLRAAIEAGVDPAALVESINEAQAQRASAKAEMDSAASAGSNLLSDAEIYAMIDSLGDVGKALNSANPARLAALYEQLRVELIYDSDSRTAEMPSNRPQG